MHSPRRRFLGWLGGASLAGLATPRSAFAHPSPVAPSAPPPAHPAPVTDSWDMSWVAQVSGKHRAVFDSPEPSDGAALIRAVAWCEHYKEVYGVERGDMSPVLVLRHSAIDLIMGDAYWERLEIGKQLKMKDGKGKWRRANPISRHGAPAGEQAMKYTLESFLEGGGVVLACGWAFRFVVSRIEKKDRLDAAAARARAMAEMIPGVIIQPNGIFAALRAQEAGCSYVMAS